MDVGVQGNDYYPTPNIDRLAARGMRFTDGYAAAPVCSPSRAAILSGMNGARTGITDFIPGHQRPYEALTVPTNRTQYLPGETVTFAERLQAAGYATAYFGKWHLGWETSQLPTAQGFDTAHVRRGWGHFVPPVRFNPPYPDMEEGDYEVDLLTAMTVNFMADHSDRPFLVVCSHFAVHVPLAAPDEMVKAAASRPRPTDRIYNPTYVAMVQKVDQSLGRVVDALDSLGIFEQTLLVFTSDNGGLRQIFDKRNGELVTDNAPLRDEKGSIYEGGLRVPFLVAQPGTVPAGGVESTPVGGLDLYPTFLAAAGLPSPGGLDGNDLSALWTGTADFPVRKLYFHYPHYHHGRPAAAVRDGNFKLIRHFDQPTPELYDLANDLGETNDLASVDPLRTKTLLTDLNAWLEATDAPLPTPNPGFDPERREEWGRR